MRGSPHSHGLYWIDGSLEYNENDPSSIIRCREFIDMFISVEKCEEGMMAELIRAQTHRHSATCTFKVGKRPCRFGYPLPPLSETTILEPLPKDTAKSARKRYAEIYKKLQEDLAARTTVNDNDIGFDD